MTRTTQAGVRKPPIPERPRPFAAIDALAHSRDTAGLIAMLNDDGLSLVQRRRAVRALADVGNYRAVPLLVTMLSDPDRLIRFAAVEGLGRLGEEGTATALFPTLADPDPHIRRVATDALGRFNSESAFTGLLEALNDRERYIRQGAALALGGIADRRAVAPLISRLKDESSLVRAAAASALGTIGDRHATEALEKSRHKTRHPQGQDCSECKAIDSALARLQPIRDDPAT